MLNKENIDQKLFLLFAEKYDQLCERGEITEKERDAVLSLLEEHEEYEPETFRQELLSIFSKTTEDN